LITVNQAQRQLREQSECQIGSETIELAEALGRVASADMTSALAIPPSDNSAMDGFAVNSADARANQRLPISQRIPAGSQPAALRAGTAARIFTGGIVPDGADAVVIQENCQFSLNDDQVTILKGVSAGENVRPQGQDISVGACVVKRGQRLTAIDMSLLASIGRSQVEVFAPLKVAIFSTGNELVEPGQPLKPGQIYNSNRVLLMTLCSQLGYTPIDCGIVKDTLDATKAALAAAALQADVILSSGGASVGEEDHIKPAVEQLGSLALWKVQMKPGKPVAFGKVQGVPFLGLPGNPVSSFVVFQLLAMPLLQSLQGQRVSPLLSYRVKSGFAKPTSLREDYIRVRMERDEYGQLWAQRFANLSSGVMSSLSWADGLVRQDINQAIELGESIEFMPLKQGML